MDHFIALNPPLPCIDVSLGAGFVTALAADGLRVRFVESTARQTQGQVRLAFTPDQSYLFNWHLLGTKDGELHLSIGEKDHPALADLMTLVRKNQHISICATTDVEASDRFTGFEHVTLLPKALPELDWSELDTSTLFLGRKLPLPLLITGMTGGLARGAEINFRLARAAAAFGIPMGVGSQRVALDNPDHAAIFTVKKAVPDLFLIGNIGIAQLLQPDAVDLCCRAVDMIEADALAVHVNVLQEVVQVEGDRNFRGVLDSIAKVAAKLPVPLIVKEVGVGLDPSSAQKLAEAGVKALDCGGKGGTSWSFIEGERATSEITRSVAATFRDFGIPTALTVTALHKSLPQMPLIATGGIRDGLMVAKAVALGATACGIGLPLLRAALTSDEAPYEVLEIMAKGLRTAMIVSGAKTLSDLRSRVHCAPAFSENLARFTTNRTP